MFKGRSTGPDLMYYRMLGQTWGARVKGDFS